MSFVHLIAHGARTMLYLLAIATVALISFAIALAILDDWYQDTEYTTSSFGSLGDNSCNVGVLYLTGDIIPYGYSEEDTSPNMVREFLTAAESSRDTEAVVVMVNSNGWSAVGAEMIANEFRRTSLLVAGVVLESANSAGYLALTGADRIIASPFSDVGSIAVTMSYLDETLLNEREGYTFVPLSSGPYKDYLNPNKPLTDEERVLLEGDLTVWHDYFVSLVAENRQLPKETVSALATGASMAGPLALQAGLIDELGDRESARRWLAAQLDKEVSEVILCD